MDDRPSHWPTAEDDERDRHISAVIVPWIVVIVVVLFCWSLLH